MKAWLILCISWAVALGSDEPPRLAQRGVEAYQAGRMDLAKLFFERAYRQSAIVGRTDWSERAALNLADIAMEMRALEDANRWLDAAKDATGVNRQLLLWKRSQLLHLRGQSKLAIHTLDSAFHLGSNEAVTLVRMKIDRFRYTLNIQDSISWELEFEKFSRNLKLSHRREVLGLSAWSRMRRNNFKEAEKLWSEAVVVYRENHRLLAIGEALAYRSLCLHAINRREEALQVAAQAEGVFNETGYALGKLRAQALQLLLQDDDKVAKSALEVDFLSREQLGEDWNQLLEEYAQSYPPLLGRLEYLRGR